MKRLWWGARGEKRRIREHVRKVLEGEWEEGNAISREEVKEVIKSLKINKATGENGMEN